MVTRDGAYSTVFHISTFHYHDLHFKIYHFHETVTPGYIAHRFEDILTGVEALR
jgi:hypothetical protein